MENNRLKELVGEIERGDTTPFEADTELRGSPLVDEEGSKVREFWITLDILLGVMSLGQRKTLTKEEIGLLRDKAYN